MRTNTTPPAETAPSSRRVVTAAATFVTVVALGPGPAVAIAAAGVQTNHNEVQVSSTAP